MLQDTLATFREGSESTISTAQGVMLIDGWLQALQGDSNLDLLEAELTELREELQSGQPDETRVRTLMTSLADKTQAVAEGPNSEGTWTGGLESLSKILRNFADKI